MTGFSVVLSLLLSLPVHGASDLRLTGTLFKLNTHRQVRLYIDADLVVESESPADCGAMSPAEPN